MATPSPLYVRAVKPPTSGPWWNLELANKSRADIPAPTQSPLMYLIDLNDVHPTAEVLETFLVPLAQDFKGGRYENSILVIATSVPAVRHFVAWLAADFELAIYLAASTSHVDLAAAEPVGALSSTDRETIEVIDSLGGRMTARQLSHHMPGLQHTAAFMRLSNLADKGYLHRESSPGRAGDVFTDPRVLGHKQFVETLIGATNGIVGEDVNRTRQALAPRGRPFSEPDSY